MTVPTLSLTEDQAFTSLRTFLVGVVPASTQVFKGQQNRVPEPTQADFIVMWPLRMYRLGTNNEDYRDNIVTASIAGSLMTVTAIEQFEEGLAPGMVVRDAGQTIVSGTVITGQVSGSVGGTGVYAVTGSQAFASGSVFVDGRLSLTPYEWTVQIDVHGPASANNVAVIQSLFRSEYGGDAFAAVGYAVTPLYCDEGKQMPFVNAEQQYEYRWVLEAVMQTNPTITTDQEFADELIATLYEADQALP